MRQAGERPHLVEIWRRTASTGSEGGTTYAWDQLLTAWAKVLYGSAMERREAATEQAVQAATFIFDWSPGIAAVKTTDRARLFDTEWDIIGRAIISANHELHFTVAARLDEEIFT